jgi:AraC-like DNA-binding protein
MSAGLSDAFETAVLALQDEGDLPDAVVRHRVTELLAWLGAFGACFSLRLPESYAARIRRLAGRRPDHDWTGAQIGGQLGVSEATLRRRLQKEGTSLRDVLTDIRMTHAMQLLQSSNMPVSAIAASAGFESQSRFAIRFRSRFGFPPTAVRGHRQPVPQLAAE